MGRTSHEVRGLKYLVYAVRDLEPASHLTRGAWIEIQSANPTYQRSRVAPHTRCVD